MTALRCRRKDRWSRLPSRARQRLASGLAIIGKRTLTTADYNDVSGSVAAANVDPGTANGGYAAPGSGQSKNRRG